MISVKQVMEFFREANLDDTVNQLSEFDKREIILSCCGHSDYLHNMVEEVITKWEDEQS